MPLVKVKVAQLCPTLCDPMDYTVHGILYTRILEWVAFPFSRGSSQPRDQTQVSRIAGGFFTSWVTRDWTWPKKRAVPPWPLSPRTGEGWRQEPKRGAVSLLSVSPWGPVRQAAVPTAPVSWAGGKGKFNESRCFSDWLWAQCKCSGRQGGVCEVGLEDGAIKKASFFF